MLITQARAVARQWVLSEGTQLPGFAGAFLTGSALWAAEDAMLAQDSDVDVTVVLDDAESTTSLGKFVYHDVLLEVSFMASHQLGPAETVLSDYHLAGSFHLPNVLADPTGRITEIHKVVSRHFADHRWVVTRCNAAMDRVRAFITGMNPAMPFPDQVSSWLFGTGVMTHVLLAAGLQNPTVRRRYEAVRELLAAHDRLDYYETLLDLLGCAQMGPARVLNHLAALETVFDAAQDVQANSYASPRISAPKPAPSPSTAAADSSSAGCIAKPSSGSSRPTPDA